MKLELPYFLNYNNKLFVGIGSAFFAALLYFLSNRFSLFHPEELPMTEIDLSVPFMPWMVWIYLSEYFLILSAFFLNNNYKHSNKCVYAFLALQFISNAIFLGWPTTYPRSLYPMPVGVDPGTAFMMEIIRQVDIPTNCAPSLHVSSCFLASFIFLKDRRWLFTLYFFWACLVGFATLATKQHYLIDVILGLLLGYLVYWYFIEQVTYYQPMDLTKGELQSVGKKDSVVY